jgi:hypothetical protein
MMIDKEEMLLRELAGGRSVIPKVTDELGPMSLWSKAGLEAEIRKAVEAEREACAKLCDAFQARDVGMQPAECAGAIRARGQE